MCALGEAQRVSVWTGEVNLFTCRSTANKEQARNEAEEKNVAGRMREESHRLSFVLP